MRSPILLYFSRRKSGETAPMRFFAGKFCSNILIIVFLSNGHRPTANINSYA